MIPTVGGIRLGPRSTVDGIGRDAVIETTLNELGQINSINIVDPDKDMTAIQS